MTTETDAAVLVLTSLAGGSKHGYAITKDVEETTGVALGPGTLYGVLGRLEQAGLIEPLAPEARRRPYRLTAAGEAALEEQVQQMRRVANLGLRRLRAAGA